MYLIAVAWRGEQVATIVAPNKTKAHKARCEMFPGQPWRGRDRTGWDAHGNGWDNPTHHMNLVNENLNVQVVW